MSGMMGDMGQMMGSDEMTPEEMQKHVKDDERYVWHDEANVGVDASRDEEGKLDLRRSGHACGSFVADIGYCRKVRRALGPGADV